MYLGSEILYLLNIQIDHFDGEIGIINNVVVFTVL